MKNRVDNSEVSKMANTPKKSKELFTTIDTQRAFEKISNEIKRMIFTRILKPGDILPSEGQLAKQFGMSRQTVREAIRRLEMSGFIVVRKGASGGPVVVETILESIGELFLDAFQMKNLTTNELTGARINIEKMILKNLFEVYDKESIALMRKTEDEAERRLAAGSPAFEDNLDFHRLMARATKNYVFVILMELIMTVVAHFHSILRIGTNTIRSAHKAHERILDAIEKRDEPLALAELEKHILAIDGLYKKKTQRAEI